MSSTLRYSLILAGALIASFIVGNHGRANLSVFPNLVSLLSFPIVLFLFLKGEGSAESKDQVDIWAGFRLGEAVVRRAAFVFAGYVAAHSVYHYVIARYLQSSRVNWRLVFFSASGTFAVTWLLGILFTVGCAWILFRRRPHAC